MKRGEAFAVFALSWAIAATVIVAALSLKLFSIKSELDNIRRDLALLADTINTKIGAISYINFCVESRYSRSCFNATPIYEGEPALLAVSMFSDVTVGFRNNTLAIVSVTGYPDCRNWALVAISGSSFRMTTPLDPIYAGETLILKCRD
ncbi:hypothetical protein IG193_03035 [Infirmifilum lucidum]|uniref:Uncharacterized protein n=1 Tax=Infirmifilum lucidum TaxID=2776706 RepID=A0A7L9FI33_9CREN|nr:hypothetical protein [Infirmifilum lucidum]QOJ79450.1 hypothetical protein IG193_03035 [Infirmifilum lucidum]